MADIYADRFLRFNISQGVARLDFARLENIDGDKKEITMTPSNRLILPLDAFMQFADQVEKIKTAILSEAEKAKEKIELAAENSDPDPH